MRHVTEYQCKRNDSHKVKKFEGIFWFFICFVILETESRPHAF